VRSCSCAQLVAVISTAYVDGEDEAISASFGRQPDRQRRCPCRLLAQSTQTSPLSFLSPPISSVYVGEPARYQIGERDHRYHVFLA
jgi:hypothetical protein